ncbi:hypothetical protein VU08_09150 [Desulfobulbus sp. F5]|nr:hypothetical protein [Desulfobulbus sp. F5]
MILFASDLIIVFLQCLVLVAFIAFAVVATIFFIKEIGDTFPSFVPRRLRLPFWLAVALFCCSFGPDIFPPVVDFILARWDTLTVFILNRFKIDPFIACFASLCLGFLIGILGSTASSLKTLLIMTERHRKGMFEELDELIARCPCRSSGDAENISQS